MLVVGAGGARKGLLTANGGHRVIVATRVIPWITGSAPPIDALFAGAGAAHTLVIPLTCPTQRGLIIANRRVAALATSVVGARIARAAAATDTLIADTRTIPTLAIAVARFVARPASEQITVTDRGGQPLIAARMIRRRAGSTLPVDALLEVTRSNEALAVVGARAAHLQTRITDGRLGDLVAVGVVLWATRHASTLETLIQAPGTTRALGVTDDVVRIVALATTERRGIADG